MLLGTMFTILETSRFEMQSFICPYRPSSGVDSDRGRRMPWQFERSIGIPHGVASGRSIGHSEDADGICCLPRCHRVRRTDGMLGQRDEVTLVRVRSSRADIAYSLVGGGPRMQARMERLEEMVQ